MTNRLDRRDLLRLSAAAGAAALPALPALPAAAAREGRPRRGAFRYCLNMSTIMGQKLPLPQQVEVAARAGYDAIEPWVRDIEEYQKSGGSLPELERRIRDHGLVVESTIGFFEWIVDDDARRMKALEQARANMELVRQIGARRIAAPPVGATDRNDVDLRRAAERYRALLELGERTGVVPQAEIWGFSKTLTTLGEAAMIAISSGHPQACILPDVFHLHKGGSPVTGLRLLSSAAIHVIHVNDYPADVPREQVTDAQRVFPGDGAAPLDAIFRELQAIGYEGVLSLELFNRDLWKQDALTVARRGLEKTKAAVHKALG